ncbi:MAG: PHB depolymerase family esterase [Rhizobiaceae bacterium]|nr:PHB depolymerase family esterase [Rhizobiaceae bacterium]
MKRFPTIDMAKATRLTREGRLMEAMAVLRGSATPTPSASASVQPGRQRLDAAIALGSAPGVERAARQDASRGRGQRGSFETVIYASATGDRRYKLFVPSSHDGRPMPLVVMLHGCTQDPDDFAAGTQMNALAEARGFLVAYPEQTRAANPSKCWNWFNADDQRREGGEPSLIAGITRRIIADHTVDEDRVYVAGLSAGGAAASIMGATHPDLFSAVGVHSGLACGAARDMASAFSAMRQGGSPAPLRAGARPVPTIVFHGDSDATVHPANGEAVVAQSSSGQSLEIVTTKGRSPGGMDYTRTVRTDAAGSARSEHWLLHGAGHAWSGGSAAGTYTDPSGPDASAEMLRFFLGSARSKSRTPA